MISPWNVGNVTVEQGQMYAATEYWTEDLLEVRRAGAEILLVVHRGFGWTNLKGQAATRDTMPRPGGEFYEWQFVAAIGAGAGDCVRRHVR